MVEHLFCNQVMAVRFCHGAPEFLFQSSTAVVQQTVNLLVIGSIPIFGASIGGLVIMGAHVLCKHEVGVRSSHPPPNCSVS
jgi:hypothetical protein